MFVLSDAGLQSLLAAVGVGARQQLPAAASINWLLKDGLGRLGRLGVAACLGHQFDSQLKVNSMAAKALRILGNVGQSGTCWQSTYRTIDSLRIILVCLQEA